MGGLHDATVAEVLWLSSERRLELQIRDLYANFAGLPEYRGPMKGRFIFSEVSKLFSDDVDLAETGLVIYEWLFGETETSAFNCEIRFAPGGNMLIECRHIECLQGDTANP